MNFMDADVCIEVDRETPEALLWFESEAEELAVPGFVAMELINGCRSNQELHRIQEFLGSFAIVWASEAAMLSALNDLAPLQLTCGIGTLDCLIAATVREQGGTLYTFNLRHFRHVPGLNAAAPYTRRQP